jgi:hypothetical protein
LRSESRCVAIALGVRALGADEFDERRPRVGGEFDPPRADGVPSDPPLEDPPEPPAEDPPPGGFCDGAGTADRLVVVGVDGTGLATVVGKVVVVDGALGTVVVVDGALGTVVGGGGGGGRGGRGSVVGGGGSVVEGSFVGGGGSVVEGSVGSWAVLPNPCPARVPRQSNPAKPISAAAFTQG